MKTIKQNFLLQLGALLIAIVAFLPKTNANDIDITESEKVYFIQIASFVDPQYKDFQKLRSIGYVYATPAPNGMQRIMMGAYTSYSTASKKLSAIKDKGFKDAFISSVEVKEEDAVYIVQLTTLNQKEDIYWHDWKRVSTDLCAQLSADKIRIAAGPYYTKEEAEEVKKRLAGKGPEDMFVKRVSGKVIHSISEFEIQGAPTSPPAARSSVRSLQQSLKNEGYYTSSVDGLMGSGTKNGINDFKTGNEMYQKYDLLSREMTFEPGVEDYTLQYYVNLIDQQPFIADQGLRQFQHPLAKVYRAYMYLNGDVTDQQHLINSLMHEAIEQTFSNYQLPTQYDFSMKYAYEDLDQLIKHLRAVHEAVKDEPDVPCWLFERHPTETAEAFAPYWNSDRDAYNISSSCGTFFELTEMRVLMAIAEDFASQEQAYLVNMGTLQQLYGQPNALPLDEMQSLEEWNEKLWVSLDQWATGSPLQDKMHVALRFAYYDALRVLEDKFIMHGFSNKDARGLGLKVLKYSVGCSLDEYCGK